MAQRDLISILSEADLYVIFDCVFEYISAIQTLASLTLVSKRARSAVYRSNGLRELTCLCNVSGSYLQLNETVIRGEKLEEKLKNGLRWLWTIGKRLKTINLFAVYRPSTCFYEIVLPLLDNLSATEKRRIESIELIDIPSEWALGLVRENRNTLRCLCVRFLDQQYNSSLHPLRLSLRRCSLVHESQSFWSVVEQCERLEVLDLHLNDSDYIPTELLNVLCRTPLKHLSLHGYFGNPEIRQKFTEVLSCDNLRNNLESLTTDCYNFICDLLFGGLARPRLSAAFRNVKKLEFEFLALCAKQNTINWLAFWAIFPTINNIKDNDSCWHIYTYDVAIWSQNVITCKTFLNVSASRSLELKIEIPIGHHSNTQELEAAVVTAATLPEDQDWCVSHGVVIETETQNEYIERVTLRKDTSTLVFDLKFSENE